jgi:metal-sulfur cluster biosynthetic enzyme
MMPQDEQTPAGARDVRATPPSDTAADVAPPQLADAPPADAAPADADDAAVTVDGVRAMLRKVKDPELNLNIVDLGLIYDIAVDGSAVKVDMSLTSPGCPSGPEIMRDAENQVRAVPGVTAATINLVWSPIWTPDRIEPRVRSYLGF